MMRTDLKIVCWSVKKQELRLKKPASHFAQKLRTVYLTPGGMKIQLNVMTGPLFCVNYFQFVTGIIITQHSLPFIQVLIVIVLKIPYIERKSDTPLQIYIF